MSMIRLPSALIHRHLVSFSFLSLSRARKKRSFSKRKKTTNSLMFFIQFLIFFLCFSSLQSTDLCILPFSSQRCQIRPQNQLSCHVDIFHSYRQTSCMYNDEYTLLVWIKNFAMFYPPFIDCFSDVMKSNIVTYAFLIDDQENEQINFELDFEFVRFDYLKFILWSDALTNVTHLLIDSPWQISFSFEYFLRGFLITILKTNQTRMRNEKFCYEYLFHSIDNQTHLREHFHSCPRNANDNQTRLCLQFTPCSRTGIDSYLCRIDQLRSTDQFRSQESHLYGDITIITTNNHSRTVHQFSRNLLKRCLAQRLILIVIHGRLEIPVINSTDLQCVNSSVGK